VTDYPMAVEGRVVQQQLGENVSQRLVLRMSETLLVTAFKFDSNREIIARAAPVKGRFPAMPGTTFSRNKLFQCPAAIDQQVRRDLEPLDDAEIWMLSRVQLVYATPPIRQPPRQASSQNSAKGFLSRRLTTPSWGLRWRRQARLDGLRRRSDVGACGSHATPLARTTRRGVRARGKMAATTLRNATAPRSPRGQASFPMFPA